MISRWRALQWGGLRHSFLTVSICYLDRKVCSSGQLTELRWRWEHLPSRRRTITVQTPNKTVRSHIRLYLTTKAWVKVSRELATSMGYKSTSEEVSPSRTSWWPPRTRILYWRKVGSSIDTNVIESSVMRSILESPPEHLEKGTKNTRRPHTPSMTTVTSLVTWLA